MKYPQCNEIRIAKSPEELVEVLNKIGENKVFIDTSFCGNNIKVKFFKMVNVDGLLYAQLKVISPKKIWYRGNVVDLTRLNEFSNMGLGLFVGGEQTAKKDSLYVATNKQKIWEKGHIGYFNLFNTLLSAQSDEVHELLEVDEDFDAEWSDKDVIE